MSNYDDSQSMFSVAWEEACGLHHRELIHEFLSMYERLDIHKNSQFKILFPPKSGTADIINITFYDKSIITIYIPEKIGSFNQIASQPSSIFISQEFRYIQSDEVWHLSLHDGDFSIDFVRNIFYSLIYFMQSLQILFAVQEPPDLNVIFRKDVDNYFSMTSQFVLLPDSNIKCQVTSQSNGNSLNFFTKFDYFNLSSIFHLAKDVFNFDSSKKQLSNIDKQEFILNELSNINVLSCLNTKLCSLLDNLDQARSCLVKNEFEMISDDW